ncbi:endothelin-converting enzyme homolog [Haemaphysalis longicornis]
MSLTATAVARFTSEIWSEVHKDKKTLEEIAKAAQKQPDTFLNTCMTVIAVLIVITLICMAIIMFRCFSPTNVCAAPEPPYNPYTNTALTCDTLECRTYVNMLRSSLVTLMEPCEDFYEFVCGGWSKAAVVPPDEITFSLHTSYRRKVEDEIGEILNNTVVTYRDQTATQKAAALYQSCIDVGKNGKDTYGG